MDPVDLHDALRDETSLVLVYGTICVAFDAENWAQSSHPARLSFLAVEVFIEGSVT